ncbi:MAG: magnesium transporter CorA family protein [Patescibacteria group bacterium]
MIRYISRTTKDDAPTLLDEFRPGSWILVEAPTEQELDALAATFALDRGHLADAVDPFEAPRVEPEENATYVYARVPIEEAKHITTTPILICVGSAFVLTIAHYPVTFAARLLEGRIPFDTTQKAKFFAQIFSEINTTYQQFLMQIARRVRAMSVELERIENRDIVQFVAYEGVLNDFLSALIPMNTILQNILSGKFFPLDGDRDATEDALLTNGQLIEASKSSLKTIVNIREAYSTIITNNLNRVIKLLTALTIVLTVPTMIASFYGMNVPLPYANSPWAFASIVGITIGICLVLIWLFNRNRWL